MGQALALYHGSGEPDVDLAIVMEMRKRFAVVKETGKPIVPSRDGAILDAERLELLDQFAARRHARDKLSLAPLPTPQSLDIPVKSILAKEVTRVFVEPSDVECQQADSDVFRRSAYGLEQSRPVPFSPIPWCDADMMNVNHVVRVSPRRLRTAKDSDSENEFGQVR